VPVTERIESPGWHDSLSRRPGKGDVVGGRTEIGWAMERVDLLRLRRGMIIPKGLVKDAVDFLFLERLVGKWSTELLSPGVSNAQETAVLLSFPIVLGVDTSSWLPSSGDGVIGRT
jgi:hypothetical protein